MNNRQLIEQNQINSTVVLDLSLLDNNSSIPCFDCLILLNNRWEQWILDRLINKARNIIASDGAANYLYDSPHRDHPSLKAIIGDLDSLRPNIAEYYKQKQISIVKDQNQNMNDFEKAVLYAHKLKLKTLVCLGVLGGRIDQQLCNLSAIEKYNKSNGQRFLAIGASSAMFLISADQQATIRPGRHCVLHQAGLFCFGRSKVETKGLKWNVNSTKGSDLGWGALISSSNEIVGNEVVVWSQNQTFFTIELTKQYKTPR